MTELLRNPALTAASPARVRRRTVALVLGLLIVIVVWFDVTYHSGVNPVDFLVYRYGSQLAFAGHDPYGTLTGPMISAGGMPFTYTPFAAVVLWPTTLLGWHTAYLLWDCGCLAVLGWVLCRLVPQNIPRRPMVIGALFLALCSTSIVTQHLDYGQINLPLMGLVAADLFRSDDTRFGRYVPRGVLVGLAAAVKLTPGLFILYFAITRQWRLAAWSTAGFLGATLLGAAAFPADSHEFFGSVIFHLSDRVAFGGGLATYGNNSITGALAALGPRAASAAVPLLLVAVVVVLDVARHVTHDDRPLDAWVIIGLAAPLISPVSWIHHWVWILPALVMIGLRYAGRRTALIGAAVLVVLFIGPGLGQSLLDTHSPWLILPGLLMRQCPMGTSIVLIIALRRSASGRGASGRDESGSVVAPGPAVRGPG